MEAARAHLAALLDVDSQEIYVVEVERTEMPLVGLGCTKEEPVQPAMVIGEEIVLAVGERAFVYHAHGPQLVFCGER